MATDRVTAEAKQHIGHRIDDAVQQDLGQMAAAGEASAGMRTSAAANPLITMLSQPGGMRQAFVLNEILQKPRALRHKTPHA